jgi:hypothetical protein
MRKRRIRELLIDHRDLGLGIAHDHFIIGHSPTLGSSTTGNDTEASNHNQH